ncbi:MAG: hypothetical protein AMXMBFR56_77530 [Polyangiaceae bacterium]
MKKQITNATQLVHAVEQYGALNMYGPQGLIIARQAIEQVMRQAGYGITFDPASAPDLVDFLTVTTVSGLEGAIAGAGLGALIGLLFKQPAAGAAIGAGLGGLAGAGRGVQRVDSGWRVRAVRELNGAPIVTISALRAA